ncbi:retropepsin-like aspartic protease [Ferdinandcohnia quinoae]|uniref:Retropepsin-like domain-containing protein n=1 Tax=Fredinandcohnia quinoae TaxID=2918902 RepID=A0AAW5E4P8_9BACI|nr:retropepsin-like aspartic protease [Fredinandcohnia sp. SECRCQ15]MCH1627473.1 retropepsin-like domain-containing protein [Fredinandcohnia sp. SECRCQ15]
MIKELSELPFIEATVTFRGQSLKLENVLLDTGSAGTIFNVNKLEEIGIRPEANDVTQTIQGVGGLEFVYTKNIDRVFIQDEIEIQNFNVELGSMDYGLEIDGIIGYDFMKEVGLVIDLQRLHISIK